MDIDSESHTSEDRPDTPTPIPNPNDELSFKQVHTRMKVAMRQAGFGQGTPLVDTVEKLSAEDVNVVDTSLMALVVGLYKRMDELNGHVMNLTAIVQGSQRQQRSETQMPPP